MPLPGLSDISTASLLRDRRVPLALTALAAAQVGAVWAGVGGRPCPLRGAWGDSLAAHAFAPALMVFPTACAVAAPLPRRQREAFAGLVERLERRTRASAFPPAALMLYWLARLLSPPGAFSL